MYIEIYLKKVSGFNNLTFLIKSKIIYNYFTNELYINDVKKNVNPVSLFTLKMKVNVLKHLSVFYIKIQFFFHLYLFYYGIDVLFIILDFYNFSWSSRLAI